MERLSFCMVTTFYPPFHFGGDAMYVHRLSNALAERGHRVAVVHCADAFRALGGVPGGGDFAHHPNVSVHRLESPLRAASPLLTSVSGLPVLKRRRLAEVFDGEDFDVVHFHNVSLVGGPGVLRYGNGVKLYTMHEHWLVCPMHVLWKNDREPCVEPACLRCTLAFRRPPQLWRHTNLLARELRHIDAFLSPSRFSIEQHRTRGFDRPVRHLPLFIPTPAAEAAAPSWPRPYFLFVGRLERIKGLDTLLAAFHRYRAADLVVAGEGTQMPELRRQASDLPHVHFLGRTTPPALAGLYAGATALVVPSVGFEVAPLVALEAFAQRTPVIVRDLGGLPEAVHDSGAGYTYSTEDELVAAMEALRTDDGLRRELGDRGYRSFRERWSEEQHLGRYLGIVAELRERRASAAGAGRAP